MTKNTKIALGCGGVGCFGLMILAIVGVASYFIWMKPATEKRSYNFNVSNINGNSNSNSRSNANGNSNSNGDSSSNSNSSSASSMSDDDKHKLYQAALMTGDAELTQRVSVKLGLMNDDFTVGPNYQSFLKDHVVWTFRNTDFIQTLGSKEKAVAYVNDHIPD